MEETKSPWRYDVADMVSASQQLSVVNGVNTLFPGPHPGIDIGRACGYGSYYLWQRKNYPPANLAMFVSMPNTLEPCIPVVGQRDAWQFSAAFSDQIQPFVFAFLFCLGMGK